MSGSVPGGSPTSRSQPRPLPIEASDAPLLIFDDATSWQVEIDLRGTATDVLARLSKRFAQAPESASGEASAPSRKAGRPKLGVIGREVTLLPRHWEWLAEQPGGASVALRKLIDAERKSSNFKELSRKSQEADLSLHERHCR